MTVDEVKRLGKPFNGYPSYNHWAVAVYVLNNEGIYNCAMTSTKAKFIADMVGTRLPDGRGVIISKSTAGVAWDAVHDQ